MVMHQSIETPASPIGGYPRQTEAEIMEADQLTNEEGMISIVFGLEDGGHEFTLNFSRKTWLSRHFTDSKSECCKYPQ